MKRRKIVQRLPEMRKRCTITYRPVRISGMEPTTMTTKEAAALLNLSVARVNQLISEGIITGTKQSSPAGEYWELSRASVETYAAERRSVGYPKGRPRK